MSYLIDKEELNAIALVLKDAELDRYIKGNESVSSRFESKFSKKIGVNYTLAVSSGTAALICALFSAGIKPNDQVIIPAYTYVATALAVLSVQAIPVIANIDKSLTIDPTDVLRKITPKTKAIIPVHMQGLPCDMNQLSSIANDYNLLIVEDVAQACGGSYRGKRLGSIGDVGAFSFNHYKMITCGEGGAITTNNKNFFNRATLYHHGGLAFEPDTDSSTIKGIFGTNFRISEISSAMLEIQLTRLDYILDELRREKNILISRLQNNDQLYTIAPCHDTNGDCARAFFFQFESEAIATDFINHATKNGVPVWRTNTNGHVYHQWISILEHHDQFCSENLNINHLGSDNKNLYKIADESHSILKRTVGFHTKIKRDYHDLDCMINTIKKIIKELYNHV